MNSLHQALAFASAARHLSFAKAARELGQSPSTVAKSITRLESQLGVKLFHRTTRHVSLTPDGQGLYAQCERIIEEIETLKSLAAGVSGAPSGILRIDMPVTYGKRVVLPILTKLLSRYPQLTIDARLSDQHSDIIREGLDAVVRIGPLADSRLVAKTFGAQHLVVCGSPEYLSRRGVPQTPYALEDQDCVMFRVPTSGRDRPWQFRVDGVNAEMHPRSRLRLGDGEALVEAARAGLGLVQVPDYMAIDAIHAGHLVEVLERYRPTPLPITIVYPASRMLPPRVRVLIDALSES
jgi:LysR family transcriptional regulator, regulator for bpeEF and oprC